MQSSNTKKDTDENYYTNETDDFSIVTAIKCRVRRFPDEEDAYGIKRVDTDKKIVEKAYKVSSVKFILRRYWYFAVALALISILCMLSMPIAMLFSFSFFGLFYYFFEPFSTASKARRTHNYFYGLSVAVALVVFYLLFFTGNYQQSLKISQGIFYGFLINYTLFYFVGLFHKYGEVYALGINSQEDWTIAQSFVWKTLSKQKK